MGYRDSTWATLQGAPTPPARCAGNHVRRRLLARPWPWFAAGSLLLAAHPVQWLWTTWTDPAYDSSGAWIFLCAVALFVWSASSPRSRSTDPRPAVALLACSALFRLGGQVLAVNAVSAMALVVDVYALAVLAGVDQRRRAISPAWLALVFALSLPLERMVQRTLGYGLQALAADGACALLGPVFDSLQCEGVRMLFAGREVLVDLPCSGARGLLSLLLGYAVLSCVKRPGMRQGLVGGAVWLSAALAGNMLRVVILALGIAFPEHLQGIDVLQPPWHEAIGLFALGLGFAPLLWWAGRVRPAPLRTGAVSAPAPAPTPCALSAGIGFLLAAAVVVALPARPLDVARPSPALHLPSNLLGFAGRNVRLNARERAYFERFGGGAARRRYGDSILLVVQTTAPLRHLHAPDECLRGAGHRVTYLGMDPSPLPTAVYRSIDPDGGRWRVRVSFLADDGRAFPSVAGAVWHWLRHPRTSWRQLQRITPLHAGPPYAQAFDRAVLGALESEHSNTGERHGS